MFAAMNYNAFDYDKFSSALKKNIGKISLREIVKTIGDDIDHYTLHRLLHGGGAYADTIIILCKWMNRPIDDFIKPKYRVKQ